MTSTSTELWAHQRKAVEFGYKRDAVMLEMGMGTGKTLVAITLLSLWGARDIIILCPKTVLGVWRREFKRHAPDRFDVLILDKGTTVSKTAEMGTFLARDKGRARVVVINFDTAKRDPIAAAIKEHGWHAMVVDESHKAKTPRSKTSMFCYHLSKRVPKRIAMTGTMLAHSPLDAYAQFRMLKHGLLCDTFTQFKRRYAIMGGYQNYQVKGWQNMDELQSRMATLAIRVTRAEALDLPEETHITVPVDLGRDAMKIYKSLKDDFIAYLESGDEITAPNTLVKLLRLQQVTSGFARAADSEIDTVIDYAKADALDDIIDGTDDVMVVFCRFKSDLATIRMLAEKNQRAYGEVSGDQKDLTPDATMPDDIQIMGVQIQSGGVGIDLTRATIGVYYSTGFSLSDYEQSLARIHRPGQHHPVTFYHLQATGTVDEQITKALKARKDVVETVLEGMRAYV